MASSLQSSRRLATYFAVFLLTICLQITCSTASPLGMERRHIERRYSQPYFPDYPPSCQICEQNYDQIDNCPNASVVLSNFSQIISSPLQFFSVIECACKNTFQSTYPQCVDCFEQTNQTVFLEPPSGNLSSVIIGMQQICALGSSIFGHVASANSELPGQTPITVASAGAAFRRAGVSLLGINGDATGALFVGVVTIVIGFGMGVWTVL